MNDEMRELKKIYKDGNLIIFIGAGISCQLGLPDLKKVVNYLVECSHVDAERFQDDYQSGNYSTVLDKILESKELKEEWIQEKVSEYILDAQDKVDITKDNNYFDIIDLPNATYMTFNYDSILSKLLLEKHGEVYQEGLGLKTRSGQAPKKKNHVFYLHGMVEDPKSIVLTNESYKIYDDPTFKRQLESFISSRTILFIGCSMNEPHFKELLKRIKEYFVGNKNYIIRKAQNDNTPGTELEEFGLIPLEFHENHIEGIRALLANVNSDDVNEKIKSDSTYEKIYEKYFGNTFKLISDHDLNLKLFQKSSNLFRKLIHINSFDNFNYSEQVKKCSNIYQFAMNALYNNDNLVPFHILGEHGVGKTMFMSFFYLYLLKEFYTNNNDETLYPIYIDLDVYIDCQYLKRFKENNEKITEDDVIGKIEVDLSDILSTTENKKIVLLIDGLDELTDVKIKVDHVITRKFLTNKRLKHKKIVGISNKKWVNKQPIYDPPKFTINLSNIEYDTELLNEYLKLMNQISKYDNVHNERNIKHLEKLGLLEINFFVINKLIEYAHQINSNTSFDITSLYSWYWLQKTSEYNLEYRKNIEEILAETAFENLIKKNLYYVEFRQIAEEPELILLNKQSSFFEFFVSKYIVNNIDRFLHYDEEEVIYPYNVYSFCKNLLFGENEKVAYDKIRTIFETDGKISNLAMYLLGRVSSNHNIKKGANDILVKILEKMNHSSQDLNGTDKESLISLFQSRSCYISLSYLGISERYSKEYICKLMQNQRWDNLNRGFYLKYYGDLGLSISRIYDLHEDCLEKFPKTYKLLMQYLKNGIHKKNQLFDIVLYTLCSLVQKRLYSWDDKCGFTSEEFQKELLFIMQNKQTKLPEELFYYVKMVQSHAKYKKFSAIIVFNQMYNFIGYKRRGWRVRNIKYSESIAEHTLFSTITAMLIMPENTVQEKERKLNVIKRLIYHDLPEIATGDIIGINQDQLMEQEKYSHYLSSLSTYPFIKGFQDHHELWSSFENINTKSENAIAKSIDKMDAWFRAMYYENLGLYGVNHMEFEKDIRQQIYDEDVLNLFDDYLEHAYDDLSKSVVNDILIIKDDTIKSMENNCILVPKHTAAGISYGKIKRTAIFRKIGNVHQLKAIYNITKVETEGQNIKLKSGDDLKKTAEVPYNLECNYLDSFMTSRLYSTQDFETNIFSKL